MTSLVTYLLAGKQVVSLAIKGTGFLAKIVRAIVGGFSHSYTMDNITSNEGIASPLLIAVTGSDIETR